MLAALRREVAAVWKVRDLALSPPVLAQLGGAPRQAHRVVGIGSSTGGPAALMQLFASYPEPPECSFVVAQHMPKGFTRGFAERLDRMTRLSAREAEPGCELENGTILLAPGGSHLEFEARGSRVLTRVVTATDSDKYAPSVNRMFKSAAKHFGADLLGVILTGMGDDGREGALAIKQAGGNVIAESEETAVIFGMPQQAIRAGSVDAVLPLPEIAPVIQTGFAQTERTEGSS